jgi:transposase InsO family protein
VGRLTLENEFLKKGLQRSLSQYQRNGKPSAGGNTLSAASQLKREGWLVNHERVLRLMREGDLLCRVKKRWARTTNSNHHSPRYPNLIKTLKHEEVNLREYETVQDVVIRLPYFLEEVYNQKRLHSLLGYHPPNEFEEALLNQENNESSH